LRGNGDRSAPAPRGFCKSLRWNFGDGTTAVEPDEARFAHAFPGPGLYLVKTSVTDNLDKTYSWVQPVPIGLTAERGCGPGSAAR
jgi:PKD domain